VKRESGHANSQTEDDERCVVSLRNRLLGRKKSSKKAGRGAAPELCQVDGLLDPSTRHFACSEAERAPREIKKGADLETRGRGPAGRGLSLTRNRGVHPVSRGISLGVAEEGQEAFSQTRLKRGAGLRRDSIPLLLHHGLLYIRLRDQSKSRRRQASHLWDIRTLGSFRHQAGGAA